MVEGVDAVVPLGALRAGAAGVNVAGGAAVAHPRPSSLYGTGTGCSLEEREAARRDWGG